MSITKTLGRVGIILAVASAVAVGQTKGSVAGVKLGDLTWTKQNIGVEVPESWCYDDKPDNCKKYGRLYTWGAANKVCQELGGNWRLPTKEDWGGLIKFAGGKDVAGKKLKAKGGWERCDSDGDDCTENSNGTDDYGFSALPGGTRTSDGRPHLRGDDVGTYGFFWGATEYDKGKAYRYYMSYYNDRVDENATVKTLGFSVRCVRD